MSREVKTIVWNPDECDLLQGDVIAFKLPNDFAINKTISIDPNKTRGTIVVAEGEVSGHHHEIMLGVKIPQPTSFRDDAIARDVIAANPVPTATVKFWQDAEGVNKLVRDGELSTNTLAIGLMEIEGGPVALEHPEHDTWIIPPGKYYFGNQREFDAEQERRVRD